MTRDARPKPRLGEDPSEYGHRMGVWDVMSDAATEVKNVRSRAATALQKIERMQAVRQHWRNKVIPEAQRARVEHWRATLTGVLAALDAIDVDGWKPQVIADMEDQ